MTSLFPVAVMKISPTRAASAIVTGHLVAFHYRLEGADRVDLGDQHAGAEAPHGLSAALSDVAVSADNDDFARYHDVGCALYAVGERFAAAIEIVELGFCDRIVDVDGCEGQLAGLGQLVETVNARGGLFGNAAELLGDSCPFLGIASFTLSASRFMTIWNSLFSYVFSSREGSFSTFMPWTTIRVASPPSSTIMSGPEPSGHRERLLGAPPVFFERLTLPGKDRASALFGDSRRGVVLSGENVARGPAHVGSESFERLYQHGGLDRHVERTHDLEALQRLGGAVFLASRHQARHLVFRQLPFQAGPIRLMIYLQPCA